MTNLTPHSNLRDTDSEFVKLSKQGGHEGKGDTCEVYGHIKSLKLLYDSSQMVSVNVWPHKKFEITVRQLTSGIS